MDAGVHQMAVGTFGDLTGNGMINLANRDMSLAN